MMYKFFKRITDIFISLLSLIVLSPLLLFVIIILSFTGEKEIFYKQVRVGYKQKEFMIWKFASMLKISPQIGNRDVTLRNDPRVTKVGKYLRITKINELPQIFNVLVGDMSIVGPRPLMPVSFNMYLPEHKEYVYNSKPGITGVGTLFLRDEEKLVSDAVDKGRDPREFYENSIYPFKGVLEMWYQENKSYFIDILIIVLTVLVILFPGTELPYKAFKNLPERSDELSYKN